MAANLYWNGKPMDHASDIQKSLVEVDDSVLVVIDVQDFFLNRYDPLKKQRVIGNVAWLLQLAQYLDVPVIAMAEDIERCGDLNQTILDALPEGTQVHNKDFFGLVDNPEIFSAVEATGRKTAICVGTETDICVAQSAIGLVRKAYNVVTLRDAVATKDADEEVGIARMRDAGVAISSAKALYCEWLRSVSRTIDLRNKAPELEEMRPVPPAL